MKSKKIDNEIKKLKKKVKASESKRKQIDKEIYRLSVYKRL